MEFGFRVGKKCLRIQGWVSRRSAHLWVVLGEVGHDWGPVVAMVHHAALLQQQHLLEEAEGLDGGAVDGSADGDALLLLRAIKVRV